VDKRLRLAPEKVLLTFAGRSCSRNRIVPDTTAEMLRKWFATAEELGEYIGIRFGRIAPGASEPEWFFLPHSQCDGIGGFAELLRQRGAEVPHLPQIRHFSKPSALDLVRALPKFLAPRRRVEWGPLAGPARPSSSTQAPSAVAWHLFDEATTTQIRRVCRKQSYTVNSFLLKHLTKALRPFLQDQSSAVPWMVPVNLRGRITQPRDVENHSSYVSVRVRSYETAHDVHRNIYAALAAGEHWANWQAYKSGQFLSAGLRRTLIRLDRATAQWNLGGFSNLGAWDPDKRLAQAGCEGGWLFAPPVLRCQMVGAGCLTFQNRLGLTLQAHPELTTNAADARAWMDNWLREIEIDLVSMLAEPLAHPSTMSLPAGRAG
jgi:hypothetical protein